MVLFGRDIYLFIGRYYCHFFWRIRLTKPRRDLRPDARRSNCSNLGERAVRSRRPHPVWMEPEREEHDMGRRAAAIIGVTEWKPSRRWDEPMFDLDALARLGAELVDDSGMDKGDIDGFAIVGAREAPVLAPSAVAEHLGMRSRFNERVDLGGATPAGMVWRAAAAIEMGVCNAVLVLCPAIPRPSSQVRDRPQTSSRPIYMGADAWGSPQAQFEVPAGLVGATPSYAMIARLYMDTFGLDEETLAKIAVEQRYNAQGNPDAIFHGRSITLEEVMASPMIADPLKLLEIVMPCFGGGAVLVASTEYASRGRHRPVLVSGFGEEMTHRSITSMPDMLDSPVCGAAARAFQMAGTTPSAMDTAQIYDCYTITVLRSLEDAGFCRRGEGGAFVRERDFRYDGDFPVNTNGGQLGFGQAGIAGGLTHIIEAVRQIQGRAGQRQVPRSERAFVNGNGGMMSEQVSLVLEGA
jgi:acetyl-CoA C-acetyltransferase